MEFPVHIRLRLVQADCALAAVLDVAAGVGAVALARLER